MIATDENALECDLAETYHIFDYRSLPLQTVATLSVGLRDDSRIKMALSNTKYPFNTIILALILDNLNMMRWGMSFDEQKETNKPVSLAKRLLGIEEESSSDKMVFESGSAFDEMRNKILAERGFKNG